MKRTLNDAAAALGARLVGPDRSFAAVSTDSRNLDAGALFVALQGPKFDGGEFVAAAAARGAVGAIVVREPAADIPHILVEDTLLALQKLAARWRAGFDYPVIGIAGSNGKTTVKEMTAAILEQAGPCLFTRGNFNNHIGVPLTLLRLEAAHRSAVIEIGANRLGEVQALTRLANPTIGLITNAGAEHLEGFIDLDGVAKGEGELVANLPASATAVINADDRYADYWRNCAGAARIVSFAVSKPADFTAQNPQQTISKGQFITRFTLACPLGARGITLNLGGFHNVSNALGAAAAATAAGATLEHIARGLEGFRAVSGRLQLKAGERDSRIIDDSYNANPSSVRAGLDVLRSVGGVTWLVLGDMAELGEHAADSHAQIGEYARQCGVQRLFALGEESSRAAEAFGAGAEWFSDAEALIRRLHTEISPGVTLLIKGSRINRLERVVQALGASKAV
jgi:UDP-N-acetylmuramoyl-tripeptide--D-alanyl-D-alanine ligase